MRIVKTDNPFRTLIVGHDSSSSQMTFLITEGGVGGVLGDVYDDKRLADSLDSLSGWLHHEAKRLREKSLASDT